MSVPSPWRRAAAWFAAFVAFVLLQAATLRNPGYFSHDELQWAAFAGDAGPLPWVGWTDVGAFQYRPLTFNLWLPLARALFDAPQAWHALRLALGFGVTSLLYALLRALDATRAVALAGAAAFALGPCAVYVHGWLATLSELLWSGAAATALLCVLRQPRDATRVPFATALLATTLALLAKEAALAIAPGFALAWWLSRRERRFAAAALGAALPTLLYLALRYAVLAHAPRPDGAYAWSFAFVPARWAELQLYPWLPTTLELAGVAQASGARLALASALALALAVVAWRASLRLGIAYLAGAALAIGPALLLERGYPQYGYAASALAAGALALAWPRSGRVARGVLLLAALVAAWHGANVQRELHRIGNLQARYSPALAARVAALAPGDMLDLHPERAADAAIYARLTTHVPAYRGVALIGRVRLVERAQDAVLLIDDDGTLRDASAP